MQLTVPLNPGSELRPKEEEGVRDAIWLELFHGDIPDQNLSRPSNKVLWKRQKLPLPNRRAVNTLRRIASMVDTATTKRLIAENVDNGNPLQCTLVLKRGSRSPYVVKPMARAPAKFVKMCQHLAKHSGMIHVRFMKRLPTQDNSD
jgi:hypothetical protein